jgi:hypothetical protein
LWKRDAIISSILIELPSPHAGEPQIIWLIKSVNNAHMFYCVYDKILNPNIIRKRKSNIKQISQSNKVISVKDYN